MFSTPACLQHRFDGLTNPVALGDWYWVRSLLHANETTHLSLVSKARSPQTTVAMYVIHRVRHGYLKVITARFITAASGLLLLYSPASYPIFLCHSGPIIHTIWEHRNMDGTAIAPRLCLSSPVYHSRWRGHLSMVPIPTVSYRQHRHVAPGLATHPIARHKEGNRSVDRSWATSRR